MEIRQRKKIELEAIVPLKNKLMSEETTEKGNIQSSVFVEYFKAAGFWFIFHTIVFNIMFQG